MVHEVLQALLALFVLDFLCGALLGVSPMLSLRAAIGRRRALSPTERDRLLALEDAEADRGIAAAENNEPDGDWLVQSDGGRQFVCGRPVKRGRVMVLTVEAEGRHLETVGRRGQQWTVQRDE